MFIQIVKYFVIPLLSLSITFPSFAKDYKIDKDYKIVSEKKTQTPEIREFFSFYCSHCYSMRKNFKEIAYKFKDKAKFELNPVGLIGGDIGVESQKGYVVAQNMGIADEYSKRLFSQVHEKEQIPQDHEYFVKIFEGMGISADKVNADYNSFVTLGRVAQFDKLTSKYKIEAVPEIVINGKYLIVSEEIESVEDYVSLIDYLLTLP